MATAKPTLVSSGMLVTFREQIKNMYKHSTACYINSQSFLVAAFQH
jgi:hypothetical protein